LYGDSSSLDRSSFEKFVEEKMKREGEILSRDLRTAYLHWCEAQNLMPVSVKRASMILNKMGVKNFNGFGTRFLSKWIGLSLK